MTMVMIEINDNLICDTWLICDYGEYIPNKTNIIQRNVMDKNSILKYEYFFR